MKYRSNKKKQQILHIIAALQKENNCMPTIDDIAHEFHANRTTVWRYLREMDEDGLLRYAGKDIQLNETEDGAEPAFRGTRVPLLGSIPSLPLRESETPPEEYYTFSENFIRGKYYMLRAWDDSMVDLGIEEGNLLLIRETTTNWQEGDIVVALADGKNTLKEVRSDSSRPGAWMLHPHNAVKHYEDIHADDLQVKGVAVYCIRDLQLGK